MRHTKGHKPLRRAVFLDRDGTINVNTDYVNKPEDVTILPNAIEGLRILQDAGYELVIVTNQAGIARGYFTERDLKRVNRHILKLLSDEGIIITDIFYSPYHANGVIPRYTKDSHLRKPRPGMLLEAAKRHGLDIGESYLIGDSWSDIGAGQNAGCRANLLIANDRNKGDAFPKPDAVVKDLLEAAVWITLDNQARKIVTAQDAGRLSAAYRKIKKKIVFTNGVFDLIHPGHVEFLKLCKGLGDVLIVGLNSDTSVRKFKGPRRPIIGEKDRAEMLSALGSVDHIILFPDRTPKRLISVIKPELHVKDAAYRQEELLEYRTVVKNGGKVVQLPRIGNHSTTDIISRIKRLQ